MARVAKWIVALALGGLELSGAVPLFEKPFDITLERGVIQRFYFVLHTGDFFQIRVSCVGTDLHVSLLGPRGGTVQAITPFACPQVGFMRVVAPVTGTYELRFRAADFGAPFARASMLVKRPQSASWHDFRLVKFEQPYLEGLDLVHQFTFESLKEALTSFNKALELAKDDEAEAIVAQRMSDVYSLLGDGQKALDYAKRSIELIRTLDDERLTALAEFVKGKAYWLLHDYDQAGDSFRSAVATARTLGDHRTEVLSLFWIGQTFARSDFGRGQQYFNKALARVRTAADSWLEVVVLLGIGDAYFREPSQRAVAIPYYEKALSISHALEENPSTKINYLTNLGDAYNSSGMAEKAVHVYEKAVVIAKAEKDFKSITDLLQRQGDALLSTGSREEAIHCFDEASSFAREPKVLYPLLTKWAATLEDLGHNEDALRIHNRALQVTQTIPDYRGEAYELLGIGNDYSLLSNSGQAIEYLNRAVKRFRSIENDPLGLADSLTSLGEQYLWSGDKPQTLQALSEALCLYKQLSNREGEAEALGHLGELHESSGEHSAAIVELLRALSLQRELNDNTSAAELLEALGNAYAATDHFDDALNAFNESLKLERAEKDLNDEVSTLASLAIALRDQGYVAKALEHLRKSIKIAESLRVRVVNPYLRATAFSGINWIYDAFINTAMAAYEDNPTSDPPREALEMHEHALARMLLDRAGEGRDAMHKGVDPNLLQRERALLEELERWSERQVQTHRRETDRRSDVLLELQAVQAQIRAASPRHASFSQPQPLRLPDIQRQVVDSDTILFEYKISKSDSYLWVVTADNLAAFRLPGSTILEPLISEFRDQMASQSQFSEQMDWSLGERLSSLLLGPATTLLSGKRVLVVTDGALNYLPFAALPEPGMKGPNPVPLGIGHEVINLPSASMLPVIRSESQIRARAKKTIAIFADPVFRADDSRLHGSRVRGLLTDPQGLPRLVNSRDEAERIFKLARRDGMKAIGLKATRETALSTGMASYRYIHFATHSSVDPDQLAFSGLLLSEFDRHGQSKKGLLTLQDVYAMNLNADLVTLSACQTAIGDEIHGEGLSGLSHAFMYAGASRVIASLWKVDDRATVVFMEAFYRALLTEHLSASAAIKTARNSMMHTQWSSPYFWAAFVLTGDWK